MKRYLKWFLVLLMLSGSTIMTGCGVIDGIAQDLGARDGEIDELQRQINELESNISGLNKEISQLEQKLNDANDEIVRLNYEHEIELLNNELELKQSELDELIVGSEQNTSI